VSFSFSCIPFDGNEKVSDVEHDFDDSFHKQYYDLWNSIFHVFFLKRSMETRENF